MAFKIYKKNNYIIIEDTVAGKQYQGLAKDVFVYKDTLSETTYDFEGLTYNGLKGIALSDLIDETDTPFADEQAFIDFYTENTGNFNSGGSSPSTPTPDATDTVKGIMKKYSSSGSNTDGTMDQLSISQAITAGVSSASITGTSVLINDPTIIKSGIDYRFNDFSTYTKLQVGTTITTGLNIVAAGNEFINTGKVFGKDIYSITITGTCGAVPASHFGFGLRDSSGNYWSIMYRGSTGAVQGLLYNSATLQTPDYRTTGPTYVVGDVISVRVYFEAERVLYQTAVNGVWTDLALAPTQAFRNRGEFIISIRTASTWNNIYTNIQTKADYAENVYISPTGLATNPGTEFYPTTFEKAIEMTKGVGKIVALAGDYYDVKLNFLRNVRLFANRGDKVRFIYGERITSASFTSGSTKVYEITHAAISGTAANIVFWQHDVVDPLSAILDAENEPHHNGRTHRLESLKCTYLSGGIPALEASDSNRSYWFQSGGKIYFTIKSGTNLATNPLVIPSIGDYSTSFHWQIGQGHKGVQAEWSGIKIMYAPTTVENVIAKFTDCAFLYTRATYAIQYGYSVGSQFVRCEAGGCFHSTGGVGDGFNNHSDVGVSGSTHPFAVTEFIDCWAHDNGDDGISWHQYCQTNVTGMLAEYNGSGITPASGGHGIIKNSTARKNTLTGFSSQGAPADGGVNTNVTLYSCYAENNPENFSRANLSTCKMRVINCVSKQSGVGQHYSSGIDNINSISI